MKPSSMLLFIFLSVTAGISYADKLEEGMAAFEAFDYKKAQKLLQPLAKEGNPEAQVAMGIMYAIGLGKLERDYVEALKLFHKAAEQGNADAGYYLGEIYGSPREGLQINHTEAVKWYLWAAGMGQANAQYKLGSRYFTGDKGLPMNYVEAYAWMDVARRQGNHDAVENCDMIAMILTPRDLEKAKALADELAIKNIIQDGEDKVFDKYYQLRSITK